MHHLEKGCSIIFKAVSITRITSGLSTADGLGESGCCVFSKAISYGFRLIHLTITHIFVSWKYGLADTVPWIRVEDLREAAEGCQKVIVVVLVVDADSLSVAVLHFPGRGRMRHGRSSTYISG